MRIGCRWHERSSLRCGSFESRELGDEFAEFAVEVGELALAGRGKGTDPKRSFKREYQHGGRIDQPARRLLSDELQQLFLQNRGLVSTVGTYHHPRAHDTTVVGDALDSHRLPAGLETNEVASAEPGRHDVLLRVARHHRNIDTDRAGVKPAPR